MLLYTHKFVDFVSSSSNNWHICCKLRCKIFVLSYTVTELSKTSCHSRGVRVLMSTLTLRSICNSEMTNRDVALQILSASCILQGEPLILLVSMQKYLKRSSIPSKRAMCSKRRAFIRLQNIFHLFIIILYQIKNLDFSIFFMFFFTAIYKYL